MTLREAHIQALREMGYSQADAEHLMQEVEKVPTYAPIIHGMAEHLMAEKERMVIESAKQFFAENERIEQDYQRQIARIPTAVAIAVNGLFVLWWLMLVALLCFCYYVAKL